LQVTLQRKNGPQKRSTIRRSSFTSWLADMSKSENLVNESGTILKIKGEYLLAMSGTVFQLCANTALVQALAVSL
jgi:hypothetical protein